VACNVVAESKGETMDVQVKETDKINAHLLDEAVDMHTSVVHFQVKSYLFFIAQIIPVKWIC